MCNLQHRVLHKRAQNLIASIIEEAISKEGLTKDVYDPNLFLKQTSCNATFLIRNKKSQEHIFQIVSSWANVLLHLPELFIHQKMPNR